MRRLLLLLMTMALLIVGAVPASAGTTSLDGPDPKIWLSGLDQGTPVAGSSGSATVNNNGATIKVNATGLEEGHAYTMWVVFFSDQANGCGGDGCNGSDLGGANGIAYGDGKVVDGSGEATFSARLRDGAAGVVPGEGPTATYEAGTNNEFHVVIRSHGPTRPGMVSEQIHELDGGCDTEVGPAPGTIGGTVPADPGDCGDVQLYIFG
jgi:hypothetical protein